MLIIGAKGFAKEVLEILHQLNQTENLVFYDDVSGDIPEKLYDQYQILRSFNEAQHYFEKVDNKFNIGIGNPDLRKNIYDKFSSIGGVYTSIISPHAKFGHYGNIIGDGVNIMTGSIITNSIDIGKGVIINLNCTVGHDSIIGDFVEISPGVHISGNCTIGNYTSIGTNATILPKIKIGCKVVIGAGTVVTKDIPNNCVVVGVPGKIVKSL